MTAEMGTVYQLRRQIKDFNIRQSVILGRLQCCGSCDLAGLGKVTPGLSEK